MKPDVSLIVPELLAMQFTVYRSRGRNAGFPLLLMLPATLLVRLIAVSYSINTY